MKIGTLTINIKRVIKKYLGVALLAILVIFNPIIGAVASASDLTACPKGTSMNIVAHADDDLIFMNPDIQRDIDYGKCVRTVVVTAGDAGQGDQYAASREEGSRVAYALMAEAPNEWTLDSDYSVDNHHIRLYNLSSRPNISLVYMRLSDGNIDGSGFEVTGNTSLKQLWSESTSTISTVEDDPDYSSDYTKTDLKNVLAAMMNDYRPDYIRAMDFLMDANSTQDHADHIALAQFTQAAEREFTDADQMAAYRAYSTSSLVANVSGTILDRKWNAFTSYAENDPLVCQTRDTCSADNGAYGLWMARQYTWGTKNITSLATVTASSQNTATGQSAAKAVDGQAVGYPENYKNEWATVGGKANSWINLAWKSQQTLDKVVIYDRPNLADRISKGKLTFSDGTSVAVGSLYNNGSPTIVTFAPKNTTSLKFTVTGVSATTSNVGLAEIEVISTNIAREAAVTASSQNSSSDQLAAKATDGFALGYPTDSTKEWATSGGKTGSWIKLDWVAPRVVNSIVLFDRPNASDRVLGGAITFSDGTTVIIGNLPNNGSPLVINLPAPVTTRSLQFKITSVSATTANVGLAEIQVDGS